jgi:predicted phage tail protein
MLRKVRLYGDLAKFVGERVLEADVANAAQALRFLVANWPELEKYMADRRYKIVADNWDIDKDELFYPTGQSDIKIIPVVGGAGGNWGKVLLGVALIGIGFAVGGGMFGSALAKNLGAIKFVKTVGAAMVLSGVSGMLTPVQSIPESNQDPRRSFSFSGIQNTSTAGVCCPVCYGEIITGSIVVSAGIDTHQVEA